MTDLAKKLSETARAALTFAATHADHLVRPPKLPAAAARQVIRSLLQRGLVEEVPERQRPRRPRRRPRGPRARARRHQPPGNPATPPRRRPRGAHELTCRASPAGCLGRSHQP